MPRKARTPGRSATHTFEPRLGHSLHAAGLSMEEYLGVLRGFAQSGVLRLARPWEEPGGLFSLR